MNGKHTHTHKVNWKLILRDQIGILGLTSGGGGAGRWDVDEKGHYQEAEDTAKGTPQINHTEIAFEVTGFRHKVATKRKELIEIMWAERIRKST